MKTDDDKILLAHGGGGRLTRDLIQDEIVSRFGNGPLKGLPDAASLNLNSKKIRFSTDSFVVQPFVFPGGNIGDLAVHGTVNDLAVCGALPRWLSLSMILEEGLSLALLREVLDSVKRAAAACDVAIVTGDTKVVPRGQCDGIYLNTSGIGEAIEGFELGAHRVKVGDVIIASGTLAEHGMAVLSVREQFSFEHGPKSDSAPVHRLVKSCAEIASAIKMMRDPTRGGVAAVLNEWVEGQKFGIELNEADIPLAANVRAISEMLGIDALHVASEGRMLAICEAQTASQVLEIWRSMPEGKGAVIMGVVNERAEKVLLNTLSGGRRLVDVPSGELLPRIC